MTDPGRREVIRKSVIFILNDSNAKERLPTHPMIKCLHLKLHLGELWTLSNSFHIG